MKNENDVQNSVRDFYDKVGWQLTEDEVYQNARYEDLRPVSKEYIQRCHLRVGRHLPKIGTYLLDAGSGPIQYPEYLTYSAGFSFRVCLDLSITALKEARKKIGEHGLFIVADVANMPFKENVMDGAVTLHTFHHLAAGDQRKAYLELLRVLTPGGSAVVVNGWTESAMMNMFKGLVSLMENLGRMLQAISRHSKPEKPANGEEKSVNPKAPKGTFITKIDPKWLKEEIEGLVPYEILVWRSVSVRFLRGVIHKQLFGKGVLAFLYRLEEGFPHYFGKVGQYPLIVINKSRMIL